LDRGEDVAGGLGKQMTREDLERELREAGATTSDFRHWGRISKLFKIAVAIGGEEAEKQVTREILEGAERGRKAATRKLLNEWLALLDDDDDAGEAPGDAP
jgi:hypothetical protein